MMSEAPTAPAAAELDPQTDGIDPPAQAEPTSGTGGPTAEPAPDVVAGASGPHRDLELESEYAADYLEALLDILDLDGDLDLDVEGGRAAVAIVGTGLEGLVGVRGATLEALQELTRLAVQQRSGNRSRLMLDIAAYRSQRRAELHALGVEVAERVLANGSSERLSPMSPFERKVVHDAVAAVDGVVSESEGEEPQRRVVVLPG